MNGAMQGLLTWLLNTTGLTRDALLGLMTLVVAYLLLAHLLTGRNSR